MGAGRPSQVHGLLDYVTALREATTNEDPKEAYNPPSSTRTAQTVKTGRAGGRHAFTGKHRRLHRHLLQMYCLSHRFLSVVGFRKGPRKDHSGSSLRDGRVLLSLPPVLLMFVRVLGVLLSDFCNLIIPFDLNEKEFCFNKFKWKYFRKGTIFPKTITLSAGGPDFFRAFNLLEDEFHSSISNGIIPISLAITKTSSTTGLP